MKNSQKSKKIKTNSNMTKRLISFLLSLLMIAGCISVPSILKLGGTNPFAAQAATLDTTNCTINYSGIITWWGGSDKNIIIPVKVNGITVLGIGDRVFMGKSLTSVTFESGSVIQSIGKQAFQSNSLTSLTLPDTVTAIGEAAFFLNNISTLNLGSGVVALGKDAFRNNALTAVALPAALTEIPEGAFMLNPNLKSVNLENITKIGDKAFFGCNFDTVVLPAGLTAYGLEVFAHNKRYVLTSGNSLARTYSSPGQFGEIAGIIRTLTVKYQDEYGKDLLSQKIYTTNRTIQAESTASLIVDGNTATVPVPSITGWKPKEGDTEVRKILIDGDMTYIIIYAPDNRAPVFVGLTDVVIELHGALPDWRAGVTAVSSSGKDLTDLINISLPSKPIDLTSEGTYLVTYSVTDPDNGLSRTEYRSVLIGNDPMKLEVGMGWLYEDFLYSNDGKTLMGLSTKGQSKFNGGNTMVMLPGKCPLAENGNRNVSIEAIQDGTGTEPTFPQDFAYITFIKMTDLKRIGNYAFSGGNVNPTGVRAITLGSQGATLTGLNNCHKLVSVGDYAFARMRLSDLDLKGCDELEIIGESAFEFSSSIVELDLSENRKLKIIGVRAFENARIVKLDITGCARLEEIRERAFFYSQITELDLSKNTELKIIDYLAFYAAPITELDLSKNIKLKTVGQQAFMSASLQKLILSPALEIIGDYAFYYSRLETVDFSPCRSTLKYIGNYAFYRTLYCDYDSYMGYIDEWISYPMDFTGCSKLETIGDYAFGGETYPCDVILKGCSSLKTIGNSAFGYPWSFYQIMEVDFSDCVALESIGQNLFNEDFYLAGLDLRANKNLKTIKNKAFPGLPNNSKVYLPDSVTDLNGGAFGYYYTWSSKESKVRQCLKIKFTN